MATRREINLQHESAVIEAALSEVETLKAAQTEEIGLP